MSILKESEEDILGKTDDAYNSAFLGADLELDNSRRKEILLYRHNEVVLTVEHGVTLGLLKLIYSTDQRLEGNLQGVRNRPSMDDQSPISSVILSDDRVLTQDEYELIVQDTPLSQQNLVSSSSLTSRQQAVTLNEQLHMSLMYGNEEADTSISNSTQSIFGKTEKKNQEFVCDYCHLPFVSKAKYLRHRRIHTDEKPYACVYCTETFTHHIELRKHREAKHMRDKTFKCNFCPKSFSTRAELQGHTWRHTGEKNHKCRICSKMFATKGNLKLHIDKHIGARKHKCPFCTQRFTSHSSLEGHMAKHTGMRSYKCRYCPKSFGQSGQLTAHERLHTGEKPFTCEVCGKGFRLNSTRLAHEKRHSGARPHICDVCGRSFSMPEHLRRHMKTHEDRLDRLVSCPFCKKKIFAGRNMKKHLIRHKELEITELQAKSISATLKPDREMNERDMQSIQRLVSPSHTGKSAKQTINCCECNEEFKTMRKLLEHLSDVHYQRELTSNEKKELRMRHGVQKFHHCQFCTSYFLDYRLFKSHMSTEHGDQVDSTNIKSMRKVIGDSMYKCPNCSLCFRLRSTLADHIMKDHASSSHHAGGPTPETPSLQFRCWYCPQQFENPEGVVSHMTNAHESLDVLSKRVETTDWLSDNHVSTSGLWACPHCPVNLKSEDEYSEHLSSVHYPLSGNAVSGTIQSDTDTKTGGECVIEKYLNVKKVLKLSNVEGGKATDNNLDIDLSIQIVPSKILTDINQPPPGENEKDIHMSYAQFAVDRLQKNETSNKPNVPVTSVYDTQPGLKGLSENAVFSNNSVANDICRPSINSTMVDGLSYDMELSEQVSTEGEEATPSKSVILEHVSMSHNLTEGDGKLPPHDKNNITHEEIHLPMHNENESSGMVATDNPICENDVANKPNDSAQEDNESQRQYTEETTLVSSVHSQDRLRDEEGTLLNSNITELANIALQNDRMDMASVEIHEISIDHDRKTNLIDIAPYQGDSKLELPDTPADNQSDCKTVPVDKPLKKKKPKKKKKNKKKRSVNEEASFSCWFCSASFSSPEIAVSHMTSQHDNLDSLSRRVETTDSLTQRIDMTDSVTRTVESTDNSVSNIHLNANAMKDQQNSHDRLTLGVDDICKAREISLSPMQNFNCPRCPRKLDSKEAFELHMMVHEATQNIQIDRSQTISPLQALSSVPVINSEQNLIMPGKMVKESNFSSKRTCKSSRNTEAKAFSSVIGLNPAAGRCPHCDRLFCGKKALDTHIYKMHGKEFLQKNSTESSSPFTCWFCNATFLSPEAVVDHMTNAHENLDSLSKRVEENMPPSYAPTSSNAASFSTNNNNILRTKESFPAMSASEKKDLSKQPQCKADIETSMGIPHQADTETEQMSADHHQPPPGYKVSYALAYVPIFVPDKGDGDEEST